MSGKPTKQEAVYWGSRIGVVLAVAGSAVGLGNFLRFPGNAAANGAGAFMIPYFIALLVVGIPLAWAEWTMGRYSGVRGFHSAPGIFAAICRTRWASLIGSLALLIPLMVYTYYVVIEAWCLGYAWHYLTGDLMKGAHPGAYNEFFDRFTGSGSDGGALEFKSTGVLIFVAITFLLNFALILRGLNRGIETFCKFALPLMIVCALCVLVRVLTLGTPPLDTAANLKIYELQLEGQPDDPQRHLWLATALYRNGQIEAARTAADLGLKRVNDLPAHILSVVNQKAGVDLQLENDPKPEEANKLKAAQSKMAQRLDDLAIERARPKDTGPAEKLGLWGFFKSFFADKQPDYSKLEPALASIAAGNVPDYSNQSVEGGLNFMWNPEWDKLWRPKTWLAAAGQIFFSLSVGFGVIINYASYLRRREDIALSSLTASTTNEFFEVCLGGLITLPAAFIFLGVAAGTYGTFGLGFNALPNVFASMPGGRIFGFLWFFMLFLAAITSSLSMLQPVMAFIEEGLGLTRAKAASLLCLIAAGGCSFVVFYSKGLQALDNIDFWCGTFLIVTLATVQSIIYGWVFGAAKGHEELQMGASIRVPSFIPFLLKYVTPLFLLIILGATIVEQSGTYITNFRENEVARNSVYLILGVLAFLIVTIIIAVIRWTKQGRFDWIANDENGKA